MKFDQWLDQQLMKNDISRGKAAELFQISRHSLHKWLTRRAFPSMRSLRRIAAVLALLRGCPVDQVRGEIANTVRFELSE